MSKQSENTQPAKEKLTRRVGFRLSEADCAAIANELTVSGLSVSALIRKRLLKERVASKADLAVLAELRRLGGLLKHVHNETRGAYSSLTAQAIRDLSAYVKALTERTKKTASPEAHQ